MIEFPGQKGLKGTIDFIYDLRERLRTWAKNQALGPGLKTNKSIRERLEEPWPKGNNSGKRIPNALQKFTKIKEGPIPFLEKRLRAQSPYQIRETFEMTLSQPREKTHPC